MPTYNGHPYSTTRNLNVKGGLIRFGRTWSSNPFSSTENGLYIDSNNKLVFSSQGAQKYVIPVSVSPSKSPSVSPSISPS